MSVAVLGWTVVHSLWQWTLIAGLAALVLGCLRGARAHTRYMVGAVAFVTMVASTIVTAVAAAMTLEPPLHHRVLYAFDGALIMPELFARGATLLRAVAIVWLAGAALAALQLAPEFVRVRRLARLHRHPLEGEVTALAEALRREMHVRPEVAVYRSSLAAVPMVLGARRPQVLLPAGSATALTPDQTRSILAHEFGHVRRHDVAANLVQAMLEIITFHHPAARWLSRQLRLEREYACDEIVVGITGDANGYARALATLEDARCDGHLVVAAATGTLLERIERIVGRARPALTPVRGVLACAAAVVAAAALLALSLNMPPPWLPAGIRIRVPNPAMRRGAHDPPQTGFPGASRSDTFSLRESPVTR
jgi:beta-lactamase regulating signal transducer with metallopeptidase domain